MTPALIALARDIPSLSAHRVGAQAIKTLIVFVFLVVGFRVLGKRETATLNIVLKADMQGSLEAVTESLKRLERDDVKLSFV